MNLALPRAPEAAPPVGFRKVIPAWVKRAVRHKQQSRCATCGEPLPLSNEQVEFDHDPPIQLRTWDEENSDTLPVCNDPTFIWARHDVCHDRKTFGDGNGRGDISTIAKTKRAAKRQEEFRSRMCAKNTDPENVPEPPRRKRKWPSRPFRWRKP
jgi:hypothetical protein